MNFKSEVQSCSFNVPKHVDKDWKGLLKLTKYDLTMVQKDPDEMKNIRLELRKQFEQDGSEQQNDEDSATTL